MYQLASKKAVKQYPTSYKGFSCVESLLAMSLGVGVMGCAILIVSSFAKTSSSAVIQYDGSFYHEIPSQKALVDGVELNFAWTKLLQGCTHVKSSNSESHKSLELFKDQELLGLLTVREHSFQNYFVSEICLKIPSGKEYTYRICAQDLDPVRTDLSIVSKNSAETDQQRQLIRLNLPNPMGSCSNKTLSRFSYTFFSKKYAD